MRITKEIIEKILEKQKTTGLSYGEIGRRINMTNQNVGRFMTGRVKNINDASGELLLQLLGMKEPPPSRGGHLFEIAVNSKAMVPTIGWKQTVLGRSAHYNDIDSGAIVVVCFTDKERKDRTVCRYFSRHGKKVVLTAENGSEITTTVGRINWIAEVFFPTRQITAL